MSLLLLFGGATAVVLTPEPKILAAFASYHETVTAFAEYTETAEALADYDEIADGFASEG